MPDSNLSRRELLGYSATFGSAFLAAQGLLAPGLPAQQPKGSRRQGVKSTR